MGPDYERPKTRLPEIWNQPVPPRSPDVVATDPTEWWTVFKDDTLTELIHQAATDNLDLQRAYARVEESRALLGFARGEYWPSIDGSGAAGVQGINDLSGGASLPDRNVEIYGVGLDASWEIDLWGRVRRSVESASAGLQASLEDYRDARVSLLADIANTYLSLRETRLRIILAEENIARQKETLQMTEARFSAGLVPELDVNQSRVNLARTESSLPLLHQNLTITLNRLAVLLGRSPAELNLDSSDSDVPLPGLDVAVGIPANLLRQRPDVRAAEQRLIAQTAQIGVARADLLPRISLSGSFALDAREAGDLSNSGSQSYFFGPTFRWALFQGGRIRSNIEAQESRTDQAVYQYQQSVLLALEDVENSFVAYRMEQDRRAAFQRSVDAAQKTVEQTRILYENGLVTFLNVLDAERSLADLQDQLAQSSGQLSRNIVGLYRSLGGGWELPNEEEPAPSESMRAEEIETARETLAEHDTLATFEGLSYRECMGMTALCPDRCGHSGHFASFAIDEYKAYRKPGQYGDPITETFIIQVDDNLGQSKLPLDQKAVLDSLKPGSKVHLAWKHDYVTKGNASSPERIITVLEPVNP